MPEPGDHWLWRLSAANWTAAARTELALAAQSADTRRRAITHARRSAGMILNAFLVHMHGQGWDEERCETILGRSYVDHLRRLATESPISEVPAELGPPAAALLGIPVVPAPGLVKLSNGPRADVEQCLRHAQAILDAVVGLIGRSE